MSIQQLRTIYQIKVSLAGSKPPIWRRLLVPSSIQLELFHAAIQISMGWTNSHLHQFITKDRSFYGIKDDDFGIKDERKFRLEQLLKNEKDSMIYEYDFGDSWTHKVVLEKTHPFDHDKKLPYCVTGKRACPPEDCGGIWGYTNLLMVLENPEHEEHQEMLDWLGDEFDPTYVGRREINQRLREYCQ